MSKATYKVKITDLTDEVVYSFIIADFESTQRFTVEHKGIQCVFASNRLSDDQNKRILDAISKIAKEGAK